MKKQVIRETDVKTETIKPCTLCYSNGNCKRLTKAVQISEKVKEKAINLQLELNEILCNNFKKI
jgi:hypothetical protein